MRMRRCFIQADVTPEEKEAITELALKLNRTESAIIRRAVSMYASTFGTFMKVSDRQRGAQGPLPAATRDKISRTKIDRHAERRREA